MKSTICQQCGSKNDESHQVCRTCGSLLFIVCNACGYRNIPLLNYCEQCGAGLGNISANHKADADAERRHLNIMFCDLVGSTALSETLDPEELRDIVVAYQQMCSKAIEEQGGYIAQYLGDGLLVYFGYPKAHEDESQRAIKAAFKILSNIDLLNNELDKKGKPGISVRIGIHSGLVVIGDVGHGSKHERLALGETPNIAARIQSLAEPGTVLISSETYKSVRKNYHCVKRGTHTLKGISVPVTVYQPIADAALVSEPYKSQEKLQPLIGRETFTNQILAIWQNVKNGGKATLVIRGEAGIGKTHLIDDFLISVADSEAKKIVFRCAEYSQNNAFVPFIEIISSLSGISRISDETEKLSLLEDFLSSLGVALEESVPVLSSLLNIPLTGKYQGLSSSVQRIQEMMFVSLRKVLQAISAKEPVIFVLEDLQWADPSTLEITSRLIADFESSTIFYLLSCRTEFRMTPEISTQITELILPNLDEQQTRLMAETMAGNKLLPDDLIEEIMKKTDGVPLFVEELMRVILESNIIAEYDNYWELKEPLPELSIPSTLQDLLIAKLDQLGKARDIAQLGAVFGREFTPDVMEAISELDFETLASYLKTLVDEALLIVKGDAPFYLFSFRHALVQEKAYQLLLKSKRLQYHLMIAEALENEFPEFVKVSPEFVAHHYTMAGKILSAVQYWQKAGALALTKSAYREAIVFFNKGISLLPQIPDADERSKQELYLLAGLAPALLTTRGYTDKGVEAAYARAYELMDLMDDLPQRASLLRGLWSHYTVKSNHATASQIATRLKKIAEETNDVLIDFEAAKAVGGNLFWRAHFVEAKKHLDEVLKDFDPTIHYRHLYLYSEHPAVSSLTYQSLCNWLTGKGAEALVSSEAAISYARKLNHPFTLIYALGFAGVMNQLRKDYDAVELLAKETVELGSKHGFTFWTGMGNILLQWIQMQKDPESGLEKMDQAISLLRGAGVQLWISNPITLMAECYGKIDQPKKGLHVIEQALLLAEKTDEKFYVAEMYRIKGWLIHLLGHDHSEAVKYLKHSYEMAKQQQAKYYVLRSMNTIVQALPEEEPQYLQELSLIIDKFEKDDDSKDLTEAKSLLELLTDIKGAKK